MNYNETITAISTSYGIGGIGIIRISGGEAYSIAYKMTKKNLNNRYAHYLDCYNYKQEIIDKCIIIFFKNPDSYTGEDVVEIQAHGSYILLQMILKTILYYGARLAEPGEFTKRAYLNCKIDLIQAEAVIDLINAKSEQAVKSSLLSLKGNFSILIDNFRKNIVKIRSLIEAYIDFSDYELENMQYYKFKQDIQKLITKIKNVLTISKKGLLINNGYNIAILGKPNVGKSSLINILSMKEIAIVTTIAGTTRDIIKSNIYIENCAVNIIDTAGIRPTKNIIEKLGISKILDTIKNIDHIFILIDIKKLIKNGKDEEIFIKNFFSNDIPNMTKISVVINKMDMISNKILSKLIIKYKNYIFISAKKNIGINSLKKHIQNSMKVFNEDNIFIARSRHIILLQKTLLYLKQSLNYIHENTLEILAEELKFAHNTLSEIKGANINNTEEVLGEIFNNFCIGK